MTDSSTPQSETKRTLRNLQVAAIGALILIAGVIYTFTHISTTTSVLAFPDVSIQPSYRQPMPHFEWANGTTHLKSSDLEGGWTLISFWAFSCPPCLQELPDLDQFNEDWSGPELSIITVNLDPPTPESNEAVKEFLADNDIQIPVYFDPEGLLKKKFGVDGIPHHFLIDPKGMIVWQAQGAFNWSSVATEKAFLSAMEKEKLPTVETETDEDGDENP